MKSDPKGRIFLWSKKISRNLKKFAITIDFFAKCYIIVLQKVNR